MTPAAVQTNTPTADLIVSASTGQVDGRATAALTVAGTARRSGVLRFQNTGGAEPVTPFHLPAQGRPDRRAAMRSSRRSAQPRESVLRAAHDRVADVRLAVERHVDALHLAPGSYVFADTVTNTDVYVHHFDYGGLTTVTVS